MGVYDDIIKVFNEDATFHPKSLDKHWETHKYGSKGSANKLPKGMTKEQYASKAEALSLQKIDGKRVQAYKYQHNRVAKTNGQWFVAYADGLNGNIVTCFPASRSDWGRWKRRDNGVEIFEEK